MLMMKREEARQRGKGAASLWEKWPRHRSRMGTAVFTGHSVCCQRVTESGLQVCLCLNVCGLRGSCVCVFV